MPAKTTMINTPFNAGLERSKRNKNNQCPSRKNVAAHYSENFLYPIQKSWNNMFYILHCRTHIIKIFREQSRAHKNEIQSHDNKLPPAVASIGVE